MTTPDDQHDIELKKQLEENKICRQIVREIIKFGVNQRQLWYIVHLLGLEMDDINNSQALASFVRETKPEIFMERNEEHGQSV